MSDEYKSTLLRKVVSNISIVSLIFVTIAILFAVFIPNILSSLFENFTKDYGRALLIMASVFVCFILIFIVYWIIIFSKYRNNEIIQIIKKQPEICRDIQNELGPLKQTVTHLQSIVANSELTNSVLDDTKVPMLEASVNKDKRIIIYTSKFILEGSTEFTKIIVRNFRKGVKYIYFIPRDTVTQGHYMARVGEWYKEFASFTKSKESADMLISLSEHDKKNGYEWNPAYIELIQQYLSNYSKRIKSRDDAKAIEEKLKNMFSSQLTTYTLDTNLFFVTVAMYELEINNWHALIKLPTQRPKENFVAFSLAHTDTYERETFINNVLHLETTAEALPLQESIFTI
jgi:hypothetical protein